MLFGRLVVACGGEGAFEQLSLQLPLPIVAIQCQLATELAEREAIEYQFPELALQLALQLAAPEAIALPLAILQRQVEIVEGDAVTLGQGHLL